MIDLRSTLREGDFENLRPGGEAAGIVLGVEVARTLRAGVGDRIDVIAMTAAEDAAGFATRMRSFLVKVDGSPIEIRGEVVDGVLEVRAEGSPTVRKKRLDLSRPMQNSLSPMLPWPCDSPARTVCDSPVAPFPELPRIRRHADPPAAPGWLARRRR